MFGQCKTINFIILVLILLYFIILITIHCYFSICSISFSNSNSTKNAPDSNKNLHRTEAAYVCRRDGRVFQDDRQAAWCELDQVSTRKATINQDRLARFCFDHIASLGGSDQDQTGAGQELCERRGTGSRTRNRLRFFLLPTHLRGWQANSQGTDSRAKI